jgi:hypothetical protein
MLCRRWREQCLVYPPFSPEFAAPEDERAPVLVKSHGAPASTASGTLSLSTHYWTTRGVGVLDVNHRRSSGYGHAHRLRLESRWGIVDVEDCDLRGGPNVLSQLGTAIAAVAPPPPAHADLTLLLLVGGGGGGAGGAPTIGRRFGELR